MSERRVVRRPIVRSRAVVRDAEEERTASHLELFFDLTFVVGISQASAALHHELVAGHAWNGVVGFAGGFFAVWWAWMNFTWFASGHDSDDVAYRLLAFVQMAGVIVLAAGITRAVEDKNFALATVGYATMRSGLVINWLRVARDQPDTRTRALRYAGGEVVLQLLWIGRLFTGHAWIAPTFIALGLAELAVPVWAEKAAHRPIFNAVHIEERYGLFTIILLGEAVLSATVGFQTVLDKSGFSGGLLAVGIGGLALAFTTWWLYFDHPGHLRPTPDVAFRWGYGHVLIFISLAGLGAGIHTAAEAVVGEAGHRVAALAIAVPAAGFLLGLALVMVITGTRAINARVWPKLAGATAMLLVGLLASPTTAVVGCAAVAIALTTAMVIAGPAAPTPQVSDLAGA
jgi:low temperature requirement protein LtrA